MSKVEKISEKLSKFNEKLKSGSCDCHKHHHKHHLPRPRNTSIITINIIRILFTIRKKLIKL